MKLHLPSSLRSALLSCLSAAFVLTTGSGMLQAGEQELTFNGATLNWTTAPENQVFTAADSSPAAFAPGDNVYFTGTTQVTLGEDIAVGILGVEAGAHVNITPGAYALEAERIELSGTLAYGSALHIGEGQTLAVEGAGSVLDSALVLQDNGAIKVAAVANLNNNSLSMQGGTALSLDNTGDGRVYNLFTGVSSLLDAQGNTLVLNTTNNAVSNYFDTTRPGTGFWAGATLQLTTDGTLQLVRHSETVKDAVEFTTRQSGSVNYSYYDKVAFNDISSSSSGGAIYGGSDSTITLSDNGSVTFCGNSATASVSEGFAYVYGGAICGGSNSTITLSNNGSVTFCGNSATASVSNGYAYVYGGAIDGSTIILDNNKSVCFCENGITLSNPYSSGEGSGSAIYGKTVILNNNGFITFHKNYYSAAIYGSSVTISNNSEITFSENASAIGGGTISLSNNTSATFLKNTRAAIGGSTITINGCNSLTFSENTGGAISGNLVTLHDNDTVIINKNRANSSGGAIKGALEINNNTTTLFVENNVGSSTEASSYGGAISSNSLLLEENQSVNFSSNKARASVDANGGAIHGSYGSSISMKNNGTLSFNSNEANAGYAYGGAISASFGTIELYNNESVRFENNTVVSNSSTNSYGLSCGGAIDSNSIIIRQSNTLVFEGNQATASTSCSEAYTYGGAIYGGNIELSNNDYVTFDGNRASATSSYCALGGAIHGFSGSNIQLNNNGNVIFSGNEASSLYNSYGGAISGTTIKLNNNTSLSFNKNKAKGSTFVSGGALDGENIKLCNNGTVSFDGNSVTASTNKAYGGAIYNYGDLNIVDNESVLFEKNAEITDGSYRLRSIYAEAADIHLSVANGNSIEFRDSVYIDSGSTVYLNAAYTDSEGKIIKQEGDIIFTGAYTEAHLMEMKGGIAGTAEEILASRTSEVYATTNLYGGRLRVEDGAIYKGWGITVHEGSAATLMLKNGELNHTGYDITISSGSTLSVLGESTLTAANLIIQDGGTMQLALDMPQTDSAAVLTTTGNLSINNISFDLTGTEYLVKGDYKLLTRTEGTDYDISGWTLNGVTSEQLRWENGTLYYAGGHDWNHAVTDDDDISDLEEILGNLIINGGDVTLEAVVGAIQDAVDAGFGHGQGHIVINRGGIHISGAGDLDGHIIFNGNLKAIRKLFIEKDITGITIELGGNSQAENIVDVEDRHTMEIDSLSGEGGMSKTGEGEMVVHGNANKVGGTLDVQEGTLTFTVANDTSGEAVETETEVHELVVGNKKDKEAKVKVDKDTKVKGNKMQVDGRHAVVTNNGTMEFTEEVKVKNGHLDNQGSISKVTLEGGKVSGSGSFAGLEMHGGELVVGNSPGLQTYTDDVELSEGEVTFSLADTETAATADTHGWGAAAYSTIDMGGNALTLGENVNFVLEIGGAALESLIAADDASLTFSLSLIQNIGAESLTLDSNALAALLGNTIIMITSDAEGLSAATLYLAGRDITALLSDGSYGYEGNTLVFKGTVTNDGSLTIPEPTTATLSLLALAALAARRRRR